MLIGVTGCSGSGKSSFVRFLTQYLPVDTYTVFTQDNYYIKRELQPKDSNGVQNFDLPESLDLNTYYSDLIKLKNRLPVVQHTYNYNNSALSSQKLEIKPTPIIITEGLFVFHDPNFHQHFDHKVFIDSKPETSFTRRLFRDETERGYGFEDVNYRFYQHVLPSYAQYIAVHKDHCNLSIENSQNDLALLESAAKIFASKLLV